MQDAHWGPADGLRVCYVDLRDRPTRDFLLSRLEGDGSLRLADGG